MNAIYQCKCCDLEIVVWNTVLITHEAIGQDWQKIFGQQSKIIQRIFGFLVIKKMNDPSSSYCILVVLPLQTYNTALSKTTPAHVQGLCVLHSQPARTRFTSIRRSSVIFGIKVLPISASAPFFGLSITSTIRIL